MDLNFERFMNIWIKENKKKEEEARNLIKNETINLLTYIANSKTKFLQDDCYYYKEDATLRKYGNTITAVVTAGINILNRNNVDIIDKKEYFLTEKFYLSYNNYLFSARRVFGRGSFCEIELLDSTEIIKTLNPTLTYEDILGEVK